MKTYLTFLISCNKAFKFFLNVLKAFQRDKDCCLLKFDLLPSNIPSFNQFILGSCFKQGVAEIFWDYLYLSMPKLWTESRCKEYTPKNTSNS